MSADDYDIDGDMPSTSTLADVVTAIYTSEYNITNSLQELLKIMDHNTNNKIEKLLETLILEVKRSNSYLSEIEQNLLMMRKD